MKNRYYCPHCKRNHYYDSKIGIKHSLKVDPKREKTEKLTDKHIINITKGVIREGQKEYGTSHSGFIGKEMLEESLEEKDYLVGTAYDSFVDYLVDVGESDMFEEYLDWNDGDLQKTMKTESPLGEFSSLYIYDKSDGSVKFYGDDEKKYTDVINKFNNIKGTNKKIIFFYPESGIEVFSKFGDINKLIDE